MIVDRIEGAVAVIEVEGRTIDIPTEFLPSGAREGDKLRLVLESEDKKKDEAASRLLRLRSKDSKPDHIDF